MAHAPAWGAWNRDGAATGDVGIWHETYSVPAGQVETLYGNMPVAGLAAATSWAPRQQRTRSRAGERLGQHDPEYVPDRPAH